ncbi:putative OB-fold protein [Nocardiopsis mwathae]|uniref:Putative OB-fold protein n=1 Tax=Nocardiopsis mwathae TaxID=1472723 RepID=A0A7W9YN80_9ACTN|nr:zinc ribbon domain-containing protein [Nocardiopsis mwathae]MBB6175095.1 putative OB-fold protein [Nocardiopsis mwathae]
MGTRRVSAAEGWFTVDADGPHLLGTRCAACGTVHFPPEHGFCRNPRCTGEDLPGIRLSRRGRVWSYTDSRYPPPAPYIARSDPYEPFTLAAVELAAERIIVLGQTVPGVTVDDLEIGREMELAADVLHTDGEHEYLIWKWRPRAWGAGGVER